MKIYVGLKFEGNALVEVPDGLTRKEAVRLARNIATARVVASFDNPDAPEDDACEELVDEFTKSDESLKAKNLRQAWDNTKIDGGEGRWQDTECYDELGNVIAN